jgi:hypothetical protein
MNTREGFYCGLTMRSPFAAVLVRRRFTGAVIVGGAWENERSLQPVLDDLKARLRKEFGQGWLDAGVVGLFEDSEQARSLALLAESAVPIGWLCVYKPIDTSRQALESLLRVQGPATAKLEIDENGAGARELAQALDAGVAGGMVDALALVAGQVEDDFQAGSTDDVKVLSSWDSDRGRPS